jgi:hypothetical protein
MLNNGELESVRSLNHALHRAYQNNFITAEDAIKTSGNPTELQQMMRGAFHGTNGF